MAAVFADDPLSSLPKLSRGPHGLGDPDDRTLRKVESEVMVPKVMRERAKAEKCVPEVQAFTECCSGFNLAMVVMCRKQNDALRNCLTRWYQDEKFKSECKEEYLRERSEFRRTGLQKKHRDEIKRQQKQQQQS